MVWVDETMTNYVYYVNGQGASSLVRITQSADGSSWSAPTPITIDGTLDPGAADPSALILSNGEYLLTYTQGFIPGVVTSNVIYTAVSTDGINFTNAQPAFANTNGSGLTDPTEVQLPNGTFLAEVATQAFTSTGAPNPSKTDIVFYSSTDGRTFTPTGVTLPFSDSVSALLVMPDGSLRLYTQVSAGNGNFSGIGSLISHDNGQTWTQEPGLRLAGNYQSPSVIETAPGQWEMVVHSVTNPNLPSTPANNEISLATSSDGLNFTLTQSDFQQQGSVPDIVAYPAVAALPLPTVSSISAVTDTNTPNASTGHLVTITMTTSAAVTVTGIPTLQLNDNEVASYASGSGSNTLTFTYTVQPSDITADLQVTSLNLPSGAAIASQAGGLSGSVTANLGIQVNNAINNLITELYVGYYNRAPDPSGETYWVTQFNSGMSLSAIAQSYSVQTESTNLYSFLASPNTSSTAAINSFIAAIYQNLFNRAPDAGGQAYYVQQLQNGQNTVGGTIIAIESGAQGNDLLILNNKLTVGNYFDTQIFNNNVQFSASVASAALAAVTANASSVTTAEAIVDTYVKTAPAASHSATVSQAEVGLVGTSPSHDLAVAA